MVFDRYFGEIHEYVARRLGRDAADNVAAETFLTAFRLRRRFDASRGTVRAWLYGIATNHMSAYHRRQVRAYRTLERAGGQGAYLAVSPDGSRMAYTALSGKCGAGTGFRSPAAGAVSILDLSTGAVRSWQNTGPNTIGGLSWAPDGRTLITDERSRAPAGPDLTVFRLNTASSGGSLQAHSTTVPRQNHDCSRSSCMAAVLAGPGNSLTALEFQAADGQRQTRVLVVRIPLAAGSLRTVLYSELSDRPISVGDTGLFADPSGQWVLLWPAMVFSSPRHSTAGWISDGRPHPLPVVPGNHRPVAWV